MQTVVTELYGIVGLFFSTNVRLKLPRVSYRDYPAGSSSESSSSEDDDEIVEGQPEQAPDPDAAARPARAAARQARNERRRKAFKEDDYIQRKRDVKTQRENERTMYPMMWKRMSLLSQSRVREEEDFKTAYDTLDCVLLWTLIRRIHLMHMYGVDKALQEYNQHEQESKCGSMRQGEREHIVTFKNRLDKQVTANAAVGIAAVTESKRALDFLWKLDTQRYKVMLDDMKHDALRCKPGAFPTTLAQAFHISSEWNDRVPASTPTPTPAPAGANAAYVTDGVHVTAAKDPEKKAGIIGGGSKKFLADIECYKCETMGHYARNCPQKKSSSSEKVHVKVAESDE